MHRNRCTCANSGYQAVFLIFFERPGYEAITTLDIVLLSSDVGSAWASHWISIATSIVDSTTEQASELGVNFQLNSYLNKETNLAWALSLTYIIQQFLHLSYRYSVTICPSLVPRPHPDFISQPWRRTDFSPWLWDKIWVGPGDEANLPFQNPVLDWLKRLSTGFTKKTFNSYCFKDCPIVTLSVCH